MSMEKINFISLHKSSDPVCAEHPEGISDRDMQKVFRPDEIKSILPLIRRPKCKEHLMAARSYFTAEIDKMPLAAAVCFGR